MIGEMTLKKKLAAIIAAIMTLFVSVSAQASEVIADGFSDMALMAQHYYNTNVAEYPMTLSHPNENMYVIESTSPSEKRTELTLIKKEWGTWNLGDFNFYDAGIKKNVLGGNTDWEYTFTVFDPIAQKNAFVGGNHGSEKLIDISFANGVTGEKIELAVGESANVGRLAITEKTLLMIENKETLSFAELTRLYTVVGTTVTLDTDVVFTRDAQMAISYSAMACINKNFGRYCTFDKDMSVTTEGYGNCSNARFGYTEAMSCELHGDDTSAKVTVGIFNRKDMTDNFSNSSKVFLWDMSEAYTKLYFSRFSQSAFETVPLGTKWHFSAYWDVNIA